MHQHGNQRPSTASANFDAYRSQSASKSSKKIRPISSNQSNFNDQQQKFGARNMTLGLPSDAIPTTTTNVPAAAGSFKKRGKPGANTANQPIYRKHGGLNFQDIKFNDIDAHQLMMAQALPAMSATKQQQAGGKSVFNPPGQVEVKTAIGNITNKVMSQMSLKSQPQSPFEIDEKFQTMPVVAKEERLVHTVKKEEVPIFEKPLHSPIAKSMTLKPSVDEVTNVQDSLVMIGEEDLNRSNDPILDKTSEFKKGQRPNQTQRDELRPPSQNEIQGADLSQVMQSLRELNSSIQTLVRRDNTAAQEDERRSLLSGDNNKYLADQQNTSQMSIELPNQQEQQQQKLLNGGKQTFPRQEDVELAGQWSQRSKPQPTPAGMHGRQTDVFSTSQLADQSASRDFNIVERSLTLPHRETQIMAAEPPPEIELADLDLASGRKMGEKSVVKVGFECPEARTKADFFASIRERQTDPAQSLIDANRPVKGAKFIKQTTSKQASQYEKKFTFERGRYIQCIPNPRNSKQRITVQIVKRVLVEANQVDSSESHLDSAFNDHEDKKDPLKTEEDDDQLKSASQTYERYQMVLPEDIDAKSEEFESSDEDEKENDDKDQDSADDEDSRQVPEIKTDLLRKETKLRRKSAVPGGVGVFRDEHEEAMYSQKSLFEDVDPLLGIQSQHYADVDSAIIDSVKNRMNCHEFAVIAFWNLTDDEDLTCSNFFIVPNPTRRIIKQVQSTQLEQMLFVSESTKEVFFFWKGYAKPSASSSSASSDQKLQIQLTFLELDAERQKQSIEVHGNSRYIYDYCWQTSVVSKHSLLRVFVERNHLLPPKKQHQLPLPTVIDYRIDKNDEKPTKLLVFTAFLLDTEGKLNDSWYPTVYFYNIEKRAMEWQVYGAEQFIDIRESKIYVLTNKAWFEKSEEDYANMMLEGESRHEDHDNEIWLMRFKAKFEDYRSRTAVKERPPKQLKERTYRLTHGRNKNLEMTESCRVVSARLHNRGKYVSLLYHELGCFTFKLTDAKSLALTSTWGGKVTIHDVQNKISCQLKLTPMTDDYTEKDKSGKRLVRIEGEGLNEDNKKIVVKSDLWIDDTQSRWEGQIAQNGDIDRLEVQGLVFDYKNGKLTANWTKGTTTHSLTGIIRQSKNHGDTNKHSSKVSHEAGTGTVTSARRIESREIEFDIKSMSSETRVRRFHGKVDSLTCKIVGLCGDINDISARLLYPFELYLREDIQTDLTIIKHPNDQVKGHNSRTEQSVYPIKFNFFYKRIFDAYSHRRSGLSYNTVESDIELSAVEAVDQAVLMFQILEPDVTFLSVGDKAYVQAKLRGLEQEDTSGNGMGATETSVVLYNVSSVLTASDKHKQLLAREPKQRENFRFYLNQSFLRTQQKSDFQLWHAGTSIVDENWRIFGSVVYQEIGSDEIKLNMFSADREPKEKKMKRESIELGKKAAKRDLIYYQEPVQQSWIVDYPLLAYKTFTPKNKEIAIIHMAQDMPQRIIHLGRWEFVCFVNHTQMVEQKCFKKSKETNCDIMFLVRYKKKIRLMSFKSNPWLDIADPPDGQDCDVVKQALFIFSGDIGEIPTHDLEDGRIIEDQETRIRFKQRYNNDKLQSCQLITKQLGSYEQFMLLIQFNDAVVQASLNKNFFQPICSPEDMVRRHMVRGYNEQVFYAQTSGKVDKIVQIKFHPTKTNTITQKEIFQSNGGKLVALEFDGDCVENDTSHNVTQSLFVMDDTQKIYQIKNEDRVRWLVKKKIDFSEHEILEKVNDLRHNDWAHVHISERTLTMDGTIYNLSTKLQVDIKFPKAYFGQTVERGTNMSMAMSFIDIEDEDDEFIDPRKTDSQSSANQWQVSQVQGMSMTTNMIIVGHKDQQEFCFLLKPAPGSRKISIVGFQQLHEIEQMLFVSNMHVLLKLRGGKSVTLLANGSIIQQKKGVQTIFEKSEKVIGESQVYRGRKTVLLEDEYMAAENVPSIRHWTICFNQEGQASVSGTFQDYQKQTAQIFKKRLQELRGAHEGVKIPNHFLQAVEKAKASVNKILVKFKFQPKGKLCRFAKEFFITEKGEVIKIMALLTPNPKVKELLRQQRQANQERIAQKIKIVSGEKQSVYISIVKIKNDLETSEFAHQMYARRNMGYFTVIAIHCLDGQDQEQFVRNTQYCVVGNYLCFRRRNQQVIWITKIKDKIEDLLRDACQVAFTEFTAFSLSIDKMTRKQMVEHIQLTEVPKAYYRTIEARRADNSLKFYNNLLQVTIGTNGMIFDLDSDAKEVASIESIDQLYKPDFFANTGFIMSTSNNDERDEVPYLQRVQVLTNEHCNLLFQKSQIRYRDSNQDERFFTYKINTTISGMLYRTFADIDLCELQAIQDALNGRSRLSDIDLETIVACFEGHTIFSIFFDRIEVFEKIYAQLQNQDFPDQEDINGFQVENMYLRRLYSMLNIPTADLLHYKSGQLKSKSAQGPKKQKRLKACIQYVRRVFGHAEERSNRDVGFKSLLKKSMHFKITRFREALILITDLCEETSISDFVENLEDIEILFKSMSQTEHILLENAFKTTRFTREIKNCDWRIGKEVAVIGQSTSIALQKEINQVIKEQQDSATADESDTQNKQVEAKMLPIDWVFAECAGKTNVGFADFVVKLAEAPHDTLFSTDLVKTMVSHFWDGYMKAVVWKAAIPYCFYLVLSVAYISIYAVEGVDTPDDWSITSERVMRVIVLILIVYFYYYEVKTIIRDRLNYLFDIFNYIDTALTILNVWLIMQTIKGKKSEEELQESNIRVWAAVTVVLAWIKSFYWLRLFGKTSFFVGMILSTLYDMSNFLTLFFLILLTFGNALFILNTARGESLYVSSFGNGLSDTIMNQYLVSLGEFDFDNFEEDGHDTGAYVFFVITTLITQIVFLNMLIAIMGDTFARVSERRVLTALIEKIGILADYVFVVPKDSDAVKCRFLFAIRPEAEGHGDSWEGATSLLNKSIEKHIGAAKKQMNNRITQLQTEVGNCIQSNAHIEERLKEVHGTTQLQHSLLERLVKEFEQLNRHGVGGHNNINRLALPSGQLSNIITERSGEQMSDVSGRTIHQRSQDVSVENF